MFTCLPPLQAASSAACILRHERQPNLRYGLSILRARSSTQQPPHEALPPFQIPFQPPHEDRGAAGARGGAGAPQQRIGVRLREGARPCGAGLDDALQPREEDLPCSETKQAVEAACENLGVVLRARALALCFHAWRVFLAGTCFGRQEEVPSLTSTCLLPDLNLNLT